MNVRYRPGGDPENMSIEAFIPWVELQERRYELVDGVPSVLPWVKRNHNRIAVNIVAALARQIDQAEFEIATGDFAVMTGPATVRYADVMVEAAGGPGGGRMAETPIVLFEILSPSTADDDFGRKATEYLSLKTLKTYVIIDQEKRYAWRWSRDAEGEWPASPDLFDEQDAVVAVPGIGAELRFEDVYRNVR
jgi:Uma2 family endonuclease